MAERLLSVRLRAVVDDYEKGMARAALATDRVTASGRKFEATGRQMTTTISAPLAAAGGFAIKQAVDFEQAFTGIIKTVDATEGQLDQLRTGVIDMANELPFAREELAGLGAMAGQLGIETGNIENFIGVMADMSVATNLAGEEGASMLARFANITGMPQTEFRNLASSIVELGNNSATTEAEIGNMALRLAGAASTIGMSESQIVGLSAALSSVGVYAEMGGSAFSSTLLRMQAAIQEGSDKLAAFSRIAGMTSESFASLFESDPTEALTRFIEGVKRATDSGRGLTDVLGEVGIREIRARDAISRLAGANDLLRRSVNMSTDAWSENVAATREADLFYGTTASRLKVAWNQITDAARQAGEAMVPAVLAGANLVDPVANSFGKLIELFTKLPTGIQATAGAIAGLAVAAGPAIWVGGRLMALYAPVVDLVAMSVSKFVGAARAIALWGQGMHTAMGGLTAALMTGQGIGSALGGVAVAVGPWVALAAAVVAVGGAIYLAKKASDEFNASHRTAADSATKLAESLGLVVTELEHLNEQSEKGTTFKAQFAADNSDAIRTISELANDEMRQQYLIQVGYRLRLQGASPEETFDAIQQLAEAAGVTLPVRLTSEDVDDFENQVDAAVARARQAADTSFAPKDMFGQVWDKFATTDLDRAKADLDNVAQAAADAFKADNVAGFVQILSESQQALGDNAFAAQYLAEQAMKYSGVQGLILANGNDVVSMLEEMTRAGTDLHADQREQIQGWLDATEALEGQERVTALLALVMDDASFSMEEYQDKLAGVSDESEGAQGAIGGLGDEFEDGANAADLFAAAVENIATEMKFATLDFDAGVAAAQAFGDALARSTMVDDRMRSGLGLGSSLKALRKGFTGVTDESEKSAKSIDRVADAARAADPKMSGLELRLKSLAAAGDAFTQSISDSSMFDDQISSALNLGDAYREFSKTYRRLPAELDMVAVATGKLRPRTADAVKNMLALGKASTDYLATLIEMGEPHAKVASEAGRMRDEVQRMFAEMGLNETQISKYIEAMGLLPRQIDTAISVSGLEASRFALNAYISLLGDRIPDQIATQVVAKIDAGDIEGASKLLADFSRTAGAAMSTVERSTKKAKAELWDLPDSFDPLKAALGEYTDAQQAALDGVMRFADGVSDYLSTVAHDGNADEIRDQAYAIRDAFLEQIGLGSDVGKSYDEMSQKARDYLDLVGLSDWQIESAITLSGDAEAMFRIQMYAQFMSDKIPPEVLTQVFAEIDNGSLQEASNWLALWRRTEEKNKVFIEAGIKFDPNTNLNASGAAFLQGMVDQEWTTISGHATGGYLRGAGSSTSDSNITRYSDGEYMIRASAVDRLGIGVLDHINQTGQLPIGVNNDVAYRQSVATATSGKAGVNFGDINVVSPVESQTPARIVSKVGAALHRSGL